MIDMSMAMPYLTSPDAWIEIPEFGVMPSEVDFKGFDIPLIHQKVDLFSTNLMRLNEIARTLAQREFKTLAELNEVLSGVDLSVETTARQNASVLYQFFVFELQSARAPVRVNPQRDMEALSNAAVFVSTWAIYGAREALKLMRARNAVNASLPRPNARAIDHDEVRIEYRRLIQEGHTEREARGILVQRGNMGSQATIYRATKNK